MGCGPDAVVLKLRSTQAKPFLSKDCLPVLCDPEPKAEGMSLGMALVFGTLLDNFTHSWLPEGVGYFSWSLKCSMAKTNVLNWEPGGFYLDRLCSVSFYNRLPLSTTRFISLLDNQISVYLSSFMQWITLWNIFSGIWPSAGTYRLHLFPKTKLIRSKINESWNLHSNKDTLWKHYDMSNFQFMRVSHVPLCNIVNTLILRI